jgi:hypothetical protein
MYFKAGWYNSNNKGYSEKVELVPMGYGYDKILYKLPGDFLIPLISGSIGSNKSSLWRISE